MLVRIQTVLLTVYLFGISGQVVGVQQVDVILGSQQKTTSLLVQQQRVGEEAIEGAQEQRDAASLQQLWSKETDTQTKESFIN